VNITMVIGTRSFCTSKDSFFTRLGCVASVPTSVIRSVWPSPGAFATKSAPILPDALGLFSTTTGWPIASESFGPISRARMSEVPPGA
jgi:hypothetical protein